MGTGHSGERALIFGTVGDQYQCGRLRDQEIGQHRLADLIDPMGVLNHIDRRPLAGQSGGVQQRCQPPPTGIGINRRYGSGRVDDAEQIIKQQHVLRVCVWNLVSHSGAGRLPVKTLDAGGRPQQTRHGMKWDLAGV